jgi:hypothetical protein
MALPLEGLGIAHHPGPELALRDTESIECLYRGIYDLGARYGVGRLVELHCPVEIGNVDRKEQSLGDVAAEATLAREHLTTIVAHALRRSLVCARPVGDE